MEYRSERPGRTLSVTGTHNSEGAPRETVVSRWSGWLILDQDAFRELRSLTKKVSSNRGSRS